MKVTEEVTEEVEETLEELTDSATQESTPIADLEDATQDTQHLEHDHDFPPTPVNDSTDDLWPQDACESSSRLFSSDA